MNPPLSSSFTKLRSCWSSRWHAALREENCGGGRFGGKEAQRIRPRSKGRSRTPSRRPSFFLEEKSPLVSGRDDLENWTFRRGCRVVDWCANRTRGDDDVVLGWVMGFICPHHRRATSSLLSFVEVSPPENRLVSRGNDEKGLEKSRRPWKQGRPILIEVSLGF